MRKIIPHVTPKYLLLIAGIVWMIAGGNILRIGVPDFINNWQSNLIYLLGAAGVFLIFMAKIFYRLVQKHHTRIMDMGEEKTPFYQFFDRKSYFIMIFMIVGGLSLRSAHIFPEIATGVLYCGIGASLVVAGVLFLQKFLVAVNENSN